MHELKDDVAAASVAADAAAAFESAGNMRERVNVLADQILYMPPDQKAPLAAEGIALAQTLGAQFPEGRIRHSLADGLYSTGDFAGAVRELGLAVACFHAVGPAATGALARAYTSLGRAQRAHGLPAEALASYRAALPLQQALHDLRGMTQTWNAMGVAWSHLGQKTRSLECYRHGLTIAREFGDPVRIQFMEGAVASGLLELRRYREAAAQFEAVLDKPLDPTIARYRWEGLANAYLGLARPGDARRAVDQSLEPTSAPLLDLLPSQLLTRAKADVALGDDEMALQDARKGLDVLERTRQGLLPLDFVKQGYSDRYAEYFAFTIDVLERRGRSAEAVGVAEEARARGFADLLATREAEARNAPAVGQSSTAEVEGSARLLTQGVVPAASTGPAPDAALISPVTTAPLDAAGLAAQARRLHAPIVSYWLGPSSSYVWVVGEDGVVHGARLSVSRRRLTALVRRATDDSPSALEVTSPAAVGASGPAADPWRALHDVLIAPISRWLPPSGSRLAIIPHDVLFSLPFAALRDARGHYFVERYAFIVAPSASVLQLSSNRAPVPEGRPWLIVADPRTAPDAHLPPLPGARVEARVVAAAAPSGVRQLEGRDATLPAVITAMAGASLVHIAAHAVADDGKTGAYIALASNEGGSGGRLAADGVTDLRVATRRPVGGAERVPLRARSDLGRRRRGIRTRLHLCRRPGRGRQSLGCAGCASRAADEAVLRAPRGRRRPRVSAQGRAALAAPGSATRRSVRGDIRTTDHALRAASALGGIRIAGRTLVRIFRSARASPPAGSRLRDGSLRRSPGAVPA